MSLQHAAWQTAGLGALVLMLAACAALPPRAPVQDLKSIVGKWEGTFTLPKGQTMKATDDIHEDGTDEWTTGDQKGTTTFQVANGVIRWTSSSGRTGTVTLHEGEGKRVMVWEYDQCAECKAVMIPAK